MEYIVLAVIFVIVAILIVSYVIWCKKHLRPLTEKEIAKLSKIRTKKEIRRINRYVGYFQKGIAFKKNSSFNANGKFYQCSIDSSEFPSYIASQLFGKKHEWIVMGLVREGKVIEFWANKGFDRNRVSLSISVDRIVKECTSKNCTAILDLHNHPNSNPNKYNCLVSSESDRKTSCL